MTWDDNGIKKVIGVFSFLTLRDCTGLSAYGKVTSALDWIKEQGVEQGIQKCPSKKNSWYVITETWYVNAYPTYEYESKQYTYYYDNWLAINLSKIGPKQLNQSTKMYTTIMRYVDKYIFFKIQLIKVIMIWLDLWPKVPSFQIYWTAL